jgi:hypothetical protein
MPKLAVLFLLFFLVGCGDVESDGADGREGTPPPADTLRTPDSLRVPDSLALIEPDLASDSVAFPSDPDSLETEFDGPVRVNGRFPKPEHVKGIYLNAWAAGSRRRSDALITLVKQTELNSVVIDIKDATGFISHPTAVPLAREVGATEEIRIRDLPGLLDRLEAAGIYPIARIVVAKDPLLSETRPEFAIQDSAGGVWLDQDGVRWLNLHDKGVWDYHVDLAREVVRAGFPEIQWDYVRFPDAPEELRARSVFPGADGRTRTQAIRAFLGYSRGALASEGALVTADVFGVTTSYRKDVGIGQIWEQFIDQVDAALPMVYPSHYWTGSFGFETPNAYPYEIVRRAIREAVERSAKVEGAGAVRPWLQDFSLGQPVYDAPEIRAQIQGTYDAGVGEWILWNPGSRYTESALMPKGKVPSWLEPVMRVGGQIVPISKRFEVLGEAVPEGMGEPEDTIALPEMTFPVPPGATGRKTLPAVALPDTGGVAGGTSGNGGGFS